MKKRLIALLLTVACVLSLCAGVPVYAVEGEDDPIKTAEPAAPTAPVDEPETTEEPAPSSDPAPAEEPTPTPSVEPTPTPTPKPAGPWYAEAMDYAVKNGLLKGDNKGNLNPNSNATRAEVVTILMRIFGNQQGKNITQFRDVNAKAWYYGALSTAAEMGVLTGYPDVTMRPNAPITRQEAFVLIARLFAVANGSNNTLNRFKDGAKIGAWAKPAIAGMVESGLLVGTNGSMYPNNNITRAEFVQVLYRLNITMCSDPNALPEDGIVVYNGKAPVSVDGFKGKLFLGGGSGNPVVNGDAPAAEIFVRTEPNATVQVNGHVKGVHLKSRGVTLRGTGSADAVEQSAMNCNIGLANGGVTKNYDSGLAGVTAKVGSVAALTPENRTVTFTVSYSGGDYSTAPKGRTATLLITIDGTLQGSRSVVLNGGTATQQFSITESLWKRVMAGGHGFHIQLAYGTDVVTTDVTVPIKNYTDAEYQQLAKATYPYQIEVVRNQCVVLVYGLDKSGNYSILHQTFVCSPGWHTPLGTFRTPAKMRWQPLMGGVWGQYCTQITGNFLFHSVYYNSKSESNLYYPAYNQLGTVCSHGCVRLTVADVKWIYDNCPLGTTVRIYDANSVPVQKPTAQWIDPSSPYRGWDPTDPNPNNPWKR